MPMQLYEHQLPVARIVFTAGEENPKLASPLLSPLSSERGGGRVKLRKKNLGGYKNELFSERERQLEGRGCFLLLRLRGF